MGVAFFVELGLELEGDRYSYVRGPEGIIIGLVEELS